MLKFGAVIREFRKAAGLSQDELADRMGQSKSYVYKLEHDVRAPSPAMIVRLGRALDIPPGAILDRAAESYPNDDSFS